MTDTPEAVRLADELDKWARDYATTDYTEDMATKSAALLRRIPELEAERDQLRAEMEGRWLPIESAPKGQSVLLWFTRGGGRCVIDDWGDYDRYNHPRITHWRPLPPPPTTQEDDK